MFALTYRITGIQNILSVQIHEDQIIYILRNQDQVFLVSKSARDNISLWNIELSVDPYELIKNDNDIFVLYQNGMMKFNILKGQLKEKLQINGLFSNVFQEGYICYCYNEDINIYVPTYIKNNVIIWQLFRYLNTIIFKKNNKYIIGFSEYDEWAQSRLNVIARYEPNNNLEIPLWTLSVSEIGKYFHTFDKVWKEGQVWHFVGVVDGILWIDVMAKILIGVNVETGEIIYHFNKGINQKGEYEELPFYGKTTYDAKHHKLIGFYGDKYWEIDLSKKELKLRISNLKELLEKHEATLPNFDVSGITENHFFFGVGSMGGKRAQVLALNRNTFQIDWKYRFEGHALYFSPTKVDVTENHLFVLDNAGTLHIFEKAKV
jgi:hypothetical protein